MKLHRINVKYLVILAKNSQYICNCIHCPSSQNVLPTIVSTKFRGIQSSEKRRTPLMCLLALLHFESIRYCSLNSLTWRLTWTSGVPWWWGSPGRRWPRPGSGPTFSRRPPPGAAPLLTFTIVMVALLTSDIDPLGFRLRANALLKDCFSCNWESNKKLSTCGLYTV